LSQHRSAIWIGTALRSTVLDRRWPWHGCQTVAFRGFRFCLCFDLRWRSGPGPEAFRHSRFRSIELNGTMSPDSLRRDAAEYIATMPAIAAVRLPPRPPAASVGNVYNSRSRLVANPKSVDWPRGAVAHWKVVGRRIFYQSGRSIPQEKFKFLISQESGRKEASRQMLKIADRRLANALQVRQVCVDSRALRRRTESTRT